MNYSSSTKLWGSNATMLQLPMLIEHNSVSEVENFRGVWFWLRTDGDFRGYNGFQIEWEVKDPGKNSKYSGMC